MGETVLKPEIVARSIEVLRSRRIHSTFAGYLSVRWVAAASKRVTNLAPHFREFFETFLRIAGVPGQKPYIVPFSEEAPSAANLWFNRNVAGSYAPSSLRRVSPLRRVVAVHGSGTSARYSLRPRHWELAMEHLCYGSKVPVGSLAAFLYRDFAVNINPPTMSDLVSIFRFEFGYPPNEGKRQIEFEHLYEEDDPTDDTRNSFVSIQ